MKIKVCGMRERENIEQLVSLKPDYIGFIFYAKSPRYIGKDFTMPDIPNSIKKIGVFVNEDLSELQAKINKYRLDGVQLHGKESVSYCENVKRDNSNILVIKAIAIETADDLNLARKYEESVDLFVLDTKGEQHGGNGFKWDHTLLKNATIKKPFLLSGGIDESFAVERIENIHTQCIGVDLNSKFEIQPGLKNIKKLQSFIHEK